MVCDTCQMAVGAIHMQEHAGFKTRCAIVAFADWSSREVLHETLVDVAAEHRSPTAMLHCVDQFSRERPDLHFDIIITSERVGYNNTSGAALLGQQFADQLGSETIVIAAYREAGAFGDSRSALPVKVPASGVPQARARAATAAMPDDVVPFLNSARRLTVRRAQWTPPPFSPGLDGTDSLDSKEMAAALPWWLSKNGHLRASWNEYQGQGRWYPTLQVHEHVPTCGREFIPWLVGATPHRN